MSNDPVNGMDSGRFYRDSDKAVLFGVCAGAADYFGFRLGATRIVAVLCLLFFPPATLMVYLGVALLVPVRPPARAEEEPRDEELHRAIRRSPQATLRKVRHRFRELEERVRRMESYVASPRFKLDRDFRDLDGSSTS